MRQSTVLQSWAFARLGRTRKTSGDALNRVRMSQGEDNYQTKLTDEDVLTIRALYAMGTKDGVQLGRQFGIGTSTVYHIVQWSRRGSTC